MMTPLRLLNLAMTKSSCDSLKRCAKLPYLKYPMVSMIV